MKFQQLSDVYDKELTEIEDLIRSGHMSTLRIDTLELLKKSVLMEQDQLDSIKRFKEETGMRLNKIPGWKESVYWSQHVQEEIEKFGKYWG